MFLRKIEMFGFKSFADRCTIEFNDGISALLGPNGCGKSNVVDAIKWVLGEQRTRSLRAEKMEDVIFNGTDERKAVNIAEVVLTLSNDKGILDLDVPEVEVKRRLHRSGESEYYINNQPSRLREVRDLFLDTGVGKSAYSIMEQGRIDQILSNKPEERRFIFEEAAGISKFKIKSAEAQRKLEHTETNMKQVESIIKEVKRSYDSLKTQSEKTAKYRAVREKIFTLDTDFQLLKLKNLLQKKDGIDKILSDNVNEKSRMNGDIDKINDSLESNLDIVNNMETRLIELQKKLYGAEIERGNCMDQLKTLAETIGEIDGSIETNKRRHEVIIKKIQDLEKEAEEKKKVVDELEKRITEEKQNITGFENSIENASLRIRENEKEIDSLSRRIEEHEKNEAALQKDLTEITDVIVTQLDAKLKESGYSHKERETIEEQIDNQLQSALVQVQSRLDRIADAETLDAQSGPSDTASLAGFLKEMLGKIDGLKISIESLKQAVPSFIDEFLAPEGIITKKRSIDEHIETHRAGINACKDQIAQKRQDNKNLSAKIDEYRKTLEALRVNHARMKTQLGGVREAAKRIGADISDQVRMKDEAEAYIKRNEKRLAEIRIKMDELNKNKDELGSQEESFRNNISSLEKEISTKNKDVTGKEKSLKKMIDTLGKVQSKIEKYHVESARHESEIRNIYENFRERYSRDLTEFEGRMFEIKEEVKAFSEKLAREKDKLKGLGHVNLMAPEEFREVSERYEFLSGQLEDLTKARNDLLKVTQEIRKESRELFIKTYEQIRRNFHAIFRRLFGGGRGELRLIDPDTILESGIEILAQPPGKKLENIALLSGGERSMTGVALLFATYMVKPSPFCVLDEIDAALDEANVNRFILLLKEFAKTSQFVVITHNKKTVTGAGTLLGVTMEEKGVSKLISIRIGGKEVPANVS